MNANLKIKVLSIKMSKINEDIGSRLRDERVALGFSQQKLGEIGGVGKNTQLNYEKGDRAPDTTYLTQISSHVDVAYVLTGRRMSDQVKEESPRYGDDKNERALSFSPAIGLYAAEKLAEYEQRFAIEENRRVDCYEMIYMALYVEEHMGVKQKHLDAVIEVMGRDVDESMPTIEVAPIEEVQAKK